MTKLDWKSDPKKGEEFVRRRRDEIISELYDAADFAFIVIEENEQEALKKIMNQANDKRSAIRKSLSKAVNMPMSQLVRKFWNADKSNMILHYVGDRTKVGTVDGNVSDI